MVMSPVMKARAIVLPGASAGAMVARGCVNGPRRRRGQRQNGVIDMLSSVIAIVRCVAAGVAAISFTSISASRKSMPSSPPKCWRL